MTLNECIEKAYPLPPGQYYCVGCKGGYHMVVTKEEYKTAEPEANARFIDYFHERMRQDNGNLSRNRNYYEKRIAEFVPFGERKILAFDKILQGYRVKVEGPEQGDCLDREDYERVMKEWRHTKK